MHGLRRRSSRSPPAAAGGPGTRFAAGPSMATGPTPWALILLGLCGCSDRFVDEAVCVLSVSLSGYITATMPEEINCGAMTGGIDLLFQPEASEHPIAGFDVAVPGVGRGQTGEFPARVIVFGAAGSS